jgi:hypothetical protein
MTVVVDSPVPGSWSRTGKPGDDGMGAASTQMVDS